jgi:hypothetical protein
LQVLVLVVHCTLLVVKASSSAAAKWNLHQQMWFMEAAMLLSAVAVRQHVQGH